MEAQEQNSKSSEDFLFGLILRFPEGKKAMEVPFRIFGVELIEPFERFRLHQMEHH